MLAVATSVINGVCFFLLVVPEAETETATDVPEAEGLLEDRPKEIDIRGVALLKTRQFWQFFSLFGLLSGIGLMNIKYVLRFCSCLTSQQHRQRRPGALAALRSFGVVRVHRPRAGHARLGAFTF